MITSQTHLIIKGARQHNLKNISLDIPKNQLVVFTGLSGSGKSSLAFDTIYAEGQRRYVESLSSYARQFLGIMQKPDVDAIEGLAPAIAIDQKSTIGNPRSTVGTVTEIYDYLRLLYARIGHPHCPYCQREISPQSLDQICDSVFAHLESKLSGNLPTRWLVLAPIINDKKGEFSGLFSNLRQQGFSRVLIDNRLFSLSNEIILIKTNRHHISVILDRLSLTAKDFKTSIQIKKLKQRLTESIRQALYITDGQVTITQLLDSSLDFPENPQQLIHQPFSQKLACPNCQYSMAPPEPRLFSFNTPHGACPHCTGLGSLLKVDSKKILVPSLSVSKGALIPLAKVLSTDSWYKRKLTAVFHTFNLDFNQPFQSLPTAFKQLILYGDSQWFQVSGSNRQGKTATFSFQWEGVIPELERRYHQTDSDFIRHDLGRYFTQEICPQCSGSRLKTEALAVTISKQNIAQITALPIADLAKFTKSLAAPPTPTSSLSPPEQKIAKGILAEINSRLDFILAVGLDYLTLSRQASTLAGGEAQRIRLASQIGTGLTGILYVLDEPTIGLHPKDNQKLVDTLKRLVSLGNSLIVVEHDETIIRSADYLIDFGPKAGDQGGNLVASGPLHQFLQTPSLTTKYLNGQLSINPSSLRRAQKHLPEIFKLPINKQKVAATLILEGASTHNLKDLKVGFPLGKLICVTGVSGSGKSSLIHDTLYPALKLALNQKTNLSPQYRQLKNFASIGRVDLIDQSPIGKTPRSNPATYTKAFDPIRALMAKTKISQLKGFLPGHFSFNVPGGRCESCQGQGEVKISMQFLADLYVTCEVCGGKRYNSETLEAKFKSYNIAEILNLTVAEAIPLFQAHTSIHKRLATLQAVGLNYLKLGQPAPTLSGGEAQRVKLAKELSQLSPAHTVYLLDEPTTGLHFEDVKHLLVVLKQLVDLDNTVIIIEHNLDVIKSSDWIIDLGPEGGDNGGYLIFSGPPDKIIHTPESFTGQYLASYVNHHR